MPLSRIRGMRKTLGVYGSFALFWSFVVTEISFNYIWPIISGYLGMWLKRNAGADSASIGMVFSIMSMVALVCQPFLGLISDRLLMRKDLLYVVAFAAVMIGPVMQWVALPMMRDGSAVGLVIVGLLVGFVMNCGTNINEQYIQRASFVNRFEYGYARSGSPFIGIVGSLIGGVLAASAAEALIWSLTGAMAVYALMVVAFDRHDPSHVDVLLDASPAPAPPAHPSPESAGPAKPASDDGADANAEAADSGAASHPAGATGWHDLVDVAKSPRFLIFAVFLSGVGFASIVVGQQFLVYFEHFFASPTQGIAVFSVMGSLGAVLELVGLWALPPLFHKLGARRSLLVWAMLTVARLVGLALAPNWIVAAAFSLLGGVIQPFWHLCPMLYVFTVFDKSVFGTVQSLSGTVALQLVSMVASWACGYGYDILGFSATYGIMAVICLAATMLGFAALERTPGR